jgi:hypothetical protein
MTDYVWNNPSSGAWEDAGNWSPFTGFAPGAGDDATVTGVAATQINVTQDDSVFNLSLRDANATLNDFGGPAFLNVEGLLTLGKGHISLFDTGLLNLDGEGANLNGGSIFMQDGEVSVNNSAVVQERAGQITLGNEGEIFIGGSAVWELLSNDGIRQTSSNSSVDIEGVLEKVGGAGTSFIGGQIDDNGFIETGIGNTDFRQNVDGGGEALIFNRSELTFDKQVDISVVAFESNAGTLFLRQPQNFDTPIENFIRGDKVDLQGAWRETNLFFSGGNTFLDVVHNGIGAQLEFTGINGLAVHTGATTVITHA